MWERVAKERREKTTTMTKQDKKGRAVKKKYILWALATF